MKYTSLWFSSVFSADTLEICVTVPTLILNCLSKGSMAVECLALSKWKVLGLIPSSGTL